jgi:hypothetical protein
MEKPSPAPVISVDCQLISVANDAVGKRSREIARPIWEIQLPCRDLRLRLHGSGACCRGGAKTPVILPNLPHSDTTEDARNTA